jgi:hypothetical protein
VLRPDVVGQVKKKITMTSDAESTEKGVSFSVLSGDIHFVL